MSISEAEVIAIASRIKHYGASRCIKGIGDDCAVIRTPGGGALLMTTDVFIEGIHFLTGQTPESVGGKLLAVNLSDIAAMGGRPGEAVVALMLPSATSSDWVQRFYAGIDEIAGRFGVNVVGGDISRHPDRITMALTLTGSIRRDEVLYRKGANPGDYLYVSGTLGDADAGLTLLRDVAADNSHLTSLSNKYLSPEPRIELGRLLAKTHTSSACIDLSDGLVVGARQLAEASGVTIEILGDALPVSEDMQAFCASRSIDPVEWIIKAGGDYELLFAVPPGAVRRVERFPVTHPNLPSLRQIGRLIEGSSGKVILNRVGNLEVLENGGWEHFKHN